MKYISKIIFLSIALLFTACSSKNSININKEIKSFSLNKNVVILSALKTVKSPFSVGLGLGGTLSRHVGVNVGTVINPDISNDEALNIEKGLALHNISLGNIIKQEFSRQMENDSFYKNKFVAFGSDYKIYLSVPKYTLDSSLFTDNAYLKVFINLEILNKDNQIIYSTNAVDEITTVKENILLNNKNILTQAVEKSVRKTVVKLINDMKNN